MNPSFTYCLSRALFDPEHSFCLLEWFHKLTHISFLL
jgi:hypothetical protein